MLRRNGDRVVCFKSCGRPTSQGEIISSFPRSISYAGLPLLISPYVQRGVLQITSLILLRCHEEQWQSLWKAYE